MQGKEAAAKMQDDSSNGESTFEFIEKKAAVESSGQLVSGRRNHFNVIVCELFYM